MAQLVLGAAGAVIGFYASGGNPYGAQVGWAIGSAVGASYEASKKRIDGPRLNDLRVTGTEYGEPIPWIAGNPRIAGQIWWASDKRTVSNTTSQGKGGGPKTTTYTYEVDLLIGLAEVEIFEVSRVWSNGNLVYNRLTGASAETLLSTTRTDLWQRLTVYTGAADQMPDPTYEAAVGAANAPAYRGRGTVFIEGLQLDGSGQLPNLTFEVVTAGTSGMETPEATGIQITTPSYVSAGTLAIDGQTTYLVMLGQWDTSYASTVMNVYEVDILNPGTATLASTFNVTTAAQSAHGNSDEPLYVSSDFESNGARHYTSGGTRSSQYAFTESYGGAQIRFSKVGSDIVFGSSGFGSGRLRRYAFGGGAAVATSAALGAYVNSIQIIGDQVYAADLTSKVVWRLDLATLTLQQTINRPAFSQPVPDSWPLLLKVNGELAMIATRSTGSGYRLHLLDAAGTGWTEASGDLSATFVQTANQSQSIGVVGAVVVSGMMNNASMSPNYYRIWQAPITITPESATLQATVEALCERAGLAAAQIDATDLATITRPVRAAALSQVEAVRGLLEQLRVAYGFDATLSDKLYFRPRGEASVLTLSYEELGAAEDAAEEDPLPIVVAADLEVPPQVAVQYRNASNDYQIGTEVSDRVVSTQVATQTVPLALGLTPAEAKGVADTIVTDTWAGLTSTRFGLTLEHADLEPGDVVQVTDSAGDVLRVRVVRKTDERGQLRLECVRDDASVVDSQETTDDGYTEAGTVARAGAATWQTLDIPILRDADDSAGFYVAAKGTTTTYPGAEIQSSWNGTDFDALTTINESAVFGSCTTTLGTFTGVGFDERNSVTVSIGYGTLTSSTRDGVLADETVNVMRIGSEIVRFVTATQTGSDPNIYVLTRLLRGQRGTEWAIGTHGSAEACTLLRPQGLRRISTQASEIGRAREIQAVTLGMAATYVTATAFTDSGIALKPFAPVDVRKLETDTGTVIAWKRRTRLATRLVGPSGLSAPLGEASEVYEVDFLDSGANVVSTATVTTNQAGLAAYGVAYTVSGDYAERVVLSGSTVVASRSRAAGSQGRVYKLDSSYAVTDANGLPNNDYQGAVTGMVLIGTDVYYSHVDGSNATGIIKSAVADLQTESATHDPSQAGDYIRGIATDGTSIFAGGAYSTALRKLNTSLSVTNTYAAEFAGGLTNLHVDGGFVWWGKSGGLRKFDIAGGTGSDVTLGETASAVWIDGNLAFLLVGSECKVFDHTTGVLLAVHTAAPIDATSTYSPQFLDFDGTVCLVGARGASGYVLQLDPTTGEESGRIAVANLTALAGSSASTLWAQTLTTVSTTPLVQTRATVALEAVSVAGGSVRVYQVSATVGRGYAATLAL